MKDISRRYFFFGALALGVTGCARQRSATAQLKQQQHRVSIIRVPSYSAEITDVVRRILIDHQIQVAGKRIVVKPNLVEFDPSRPINTNPAFVAGVVEAFTALGAASVRIAEGPGHRRATLDMAEAAGFFSAIPRFEDRFTDLNLDDVHQRQIHQPFSKLRELFLPQTVLDCDLLVSLPKLKTHHWAGATLSMKNLFGLVPGAVYGWPKNILHWSGINECIADLHYLFPKQFAIVDGVVGMEGNGPILGSAKHAGLIIAGAHPPSVDATCCQLMGIDPAKIGYLELVGQRSGWSSSSAVQSGEAIATTRQDFALMPEFASLRLTA